MIPKRLMSLNTDKLNRLPMSPFDPADHAEVPQLGLFDGEAWARRTDPETSSEAAGVVEGERATELQQAVLDALALKPDGMTNHEIVAATGIAWNTITPRLRPLVRRGDVVDSGQRRLGPANRKCIVWKISTANAKLTFGGDNPKG